MRRFVLALVLVACKARPAPPAPVALEPPQRQLDHVRAAPAVHADGDDLLVPIETRLAHHGATSVTLAVLDGNVILAQVWGAASTTIRSLEVARVLGAIAKAHGTDVARLVTDAGLARTTIDASGVTTTANDLARLAQQLPALLSPAALATIAPTLVAPPLAYLPATGQAIAVLADPPDSPLAAEVARGAALAYRWPILQPAIVRRVTTSRDELARCAGRYEDATFHAEIRAEGDRLYAKLGRATDETELIPVGPYKFVAPFDASQLEFQVEDQRVKSIKTTGALGSHDAIRVP